MVVAFPNLYAASFSGFYLRADAGAVAAAAARTRHRVPPPDPSPDVGRRVGRRSSRSPACCSRSCSASPSATCSAACRSMRTANSAARLRCCSIRSRSSAALLAVATLALHGACWAALKIDGDLRLRARTFARLALVSGRCAPRGDDRGQLHRCVPTSSATSSRGPCSVVIAARHGCGAGGEHARRPPRRRRPCVHRLERLHRRRSWPRSLRASIRCCCRHPRDQAATGLDIYNAAAPPQQSADRTDALPGRSGYRDRLSGERLPDLAEVGPTVCTADSYISGLTPGGGPNVRLTNV